MYQWAWINKKPRTARLGIIKSKLLTNHKAEIKKIKDGSWNWRVFIDETALEDKITERLYFGNAPTKAIASEEAVNIVDKIYGDTYYYPIINSRTL